MDFLRAFLGVELSIPSARAVITMARLLRTELSRPDWAHEWVPPENLHVTLKFLGHTRQETLEAVVGLLRRRLEKDERPPFSVQAMGLGAFPSLKEPRVIFAQILDPSGGLAKLAADVDDWMSELGFIHSKKDGRMFHPHVTLARIKTAAGSLEEIAAPFANRDCGTSQIREVVLYESRTKSDGVEYVPHARLALQSRRPQRAERTEQGSPKTPKESIETP